MGIKLYLSKRRGYLRTVFWKILGPRSDEIAKNWRKLHSKGLHNLNASPFY
jgi:hypothetical protein